MNQSSSTSEVPRGTSARHLLGEGETEFALLSADPVDTTGGHAEHEQRQESPYEQEEAWDEQEQTSTGVGENSHEGDHEREDERHTVENNRQRLDGRPTQTRLGHRAVNSVRDLDALFLQTGEEVDEHTPSRLIEQNFRSPSNRSILIICV
mgnify:CR=1 FL=1